MMLSPANGHDASGQAVFRRQDGDPKAVYGDELIGKRVLEENEKKDQQANFPKKFLNLNFSGIWGGFRY